MRLAKTLRWLWIALLAAQVGGSVLAAEPIVIGVPTSLGTIEGAESVNAAKLAANEINAAGGVKVGTQMRPLKLEVADIRDALPGVPVPEALLGLEKMLLESKPTALVVGPFRSEALLAGMDILAKYKTPLVGSIAMTPATEAKIKEDPEKYKYVFRVSMNVVYFSQLIGGTMKTLADDFHFKKVYILNQDVLWARGTAAGMKDNFFAKTGWEVLGHDQFPTGASDFSASLRKAKAAGAEVLFVAFDMPESGILVKQWKSLRVPALIAGVVSPLAGEDAWNTFDHNIAGLMVAVTEAGNMPSVKHAPARTFYDAYKAAYGKAIQSLHGPAPSYEAVYVLKEAIERAGSTEPDAVVAALRQTDRRGVMGRIKFGPTNQVIYGADPAEASVGMFFQWTEDGKRLIVYPPSLAEGRAELPSWMK